MRQIKFKVWNTIDKCFVTQKTPCFFTCLQAAMKGSKYYEAIEYTGLKDSKGAEIYEGFIVYLAGYGNYEAVFPFIELYEAEYGDFTGAILGNVYENPELLEDE